MKILIAPNAFKHSLPADQVAEAIRDGFTKSGLNFECSLFPIGDGGDGTGRLLCNYLKAETISLMVRDPLGRQVASSFGFLPATMVAIIEMADASGIRLLTREELNPMKASSFGTGQLMKHAIEVGAKKIILCIGGSATVDVGLGLLEALGAKFFDLDDRQINAIIPADIDRLARFEIGEASDFMRHCTLEILCDVKNPLTGEQGAARIFGPQKGARETDVSQLEFWISKWCELVIKKTGKDISTLTHGGAAGGVSATLHGLFASSLMNGIEYFLDVTDFRQALADADVVITGEGRLDEQTLEGKGPFGVASIAKEHGKLVVGLAGSVADDISMRMRSYFDALIAITPEGMEQSDALKATRLNLVRSAETLAHSLSASGTITKA
jgi:glycerate 2-kinase